MEYAEKNYCSQTVLIYVSKNKLWSVTLAYNVTVVRNDHRKN